MTAPASPLDGLVATHAQAFADQIRQAAEWAGSEMDLQIEAERLLHPFKVEAGIEIVGRHNHTIGTGRPDSVYGCVIIEYKKPGVLSDSASSSGNRAIVEQLKSRFQAFRREEGREMSSMFGVGCDGRYFVFVRFREDRWNEEEPAVIEIHSAQRFLWALVNMGQKGKPYRARYLAGDFGASSALARQGVAALYRILTTSTDLRTQDFFRQWKILFSEVCGFDVEAVGAKVSELGVAYEVGKDARPAELFFAVHTYYALLMKLLAAQVYNHYLRTPSPIQAMMNASADRLRELLALESGACSVNI
jgi:hypothetical protein